MPLLAIFFGGLITKVVDFLSTFISKRLLILGLILVAFFASISALFNVLNNYIVTLIVSQPLIIQFGLSALPSNTDTCIAICLTTRLSIFIYDTQIKVMQYKLKGI